MNHLRIALAMSMLTVGLAQMPAWARPDTRPRAVADDAANRRTREHTRLVDDAAAADERADAANDDTERERRRRGNNNGDWFRDPFRDEIEVAGGFPATFVQDAVVANARAATARAVVRRAESALGAAVAGAQRNFEASPEYKEAAQAQHEAWQGYAQARDHALSGLRDDPRYANLLSLRQDLDNRIAAKRQLAKDRHEEFPAPMEEVLAIATLKMSYGLAARAIEADALSRNSDVEEALKSYQSASTKVVQMRQDFSQTLRNDPDLIAARDSLADARIAKVTAMSYLKGALEAANEAIDFAYYLHRYDGGRPYRDYRFDYPYNYPARYTTAWGY